ncbi:MAG: hypothetical protein JSW33_02705 [bacterium]|nr:MAG: hypothetical protein JSW33_02705 [bacterium]
MVKWSNSPAYYAGLSAATFLMAAISFSGVFFFKEDLIGRLISGSAWSLVMFGWLGQYYQARMKGKQHNLS